MTAIDPRFSAAICKLVVEMELLVLVGFGPARLVSSVEVQGRSVSPAARPKRSCAKRGILFG